MWEFLGALYLGYQAIKEAAKPKVTMDMHSNVKLEKEDLDKMHRGEITRQEYENNLYSGKYIADKTGKEFDYATVIANINKRKEELKSIGMDTGMEDHALDEVIRNQKNGMPMRDRILQYWYDRYDDKDGKETETATEPIETVASSAKIKSHDFNHSTNQIVTFQNLTFEIPSTWIKSNNNSSEKTLYYYPDGGMLMIYSSEGSSNMADPQVADAFMNSFLHSAKPSNAVELERYYYDDYLDGGTAFCSSYTGTFNNIAIMFYVTVMSFEDENKIIIFTYVDYSTSKYDRSEDYNSIMESIVCISKKFVS